MLEKLNEIDWSCLKHAYGSAERVPHEIMGLLSSDSDDREAALSDLWCGIYHQGTRYEATVPAIPFLFELLTMPELKVRHNVIELLACIAVGFPNDYLPYGLSEKEYNEQMKSIAKERTEKEIYLF